MTGLSVAMNSSRPNLSSVSSTRQTHMKGGTDQMESLDQEPPQQTRGALALARTMELVQQSTLVLLPRLLHNLTEIERHVLARVTVHTWTNHGCIPYIPPNEHQAVIARQLAATNVRLLDATVTLEGRQAYRMTRLGILVARQVLHFVPLAQSIKQEREFTRWWGLMCRTWEPENIEDEDEDDE
jgi:hypothetical protein